MKKFLKILGLALAGLFGLIAVSVAVAAISGVFNDEEIKIEALSWEVSKARVVDDYKATVNFLPENANVLDIELKILTAGGENIIELPESVKAGEEFTIKVKKDANGNNIGGEVNIQAKTSLVVTDPNLQILVDVPIPSNGLLIASDHDTAEDSMLINAGISEFGLYVYTNPANALNPNTGLVPDLAEDYKDISIKSTDTSALAILNSVGTKKEGFYCPNYIAHGHKGPFKDASGNPLTANCTGAKLNKVKYIEYRAKALSSTAPEVPVIVNAKALRTYSMQEQYVAKDDPKYLTQDGVFEGEGRARYYQDLSNYVNEFKDYIIADTRNCIDSENSSRVTFENGAAFIESVTKTDENGNTYIKIVDGNRDAEEAAYFYFYVECRTSFNIEDVEVSEIETNLQTHVEYSLHSASEQYDINELKAAFGLSLVASNQEFDENDLAYRYRDLRVISISDKVSGSESPYSFDFNNYFEIQNPTSTTEPVWTIRAINPIPNTDKNPRLRFYIPSSPTKEFTEANTTTGIEGDPYTDVSIKIQEVRPEEFELFTSGDNALNLTMITNNKDLNGYTYRQVLDSSRYKLTGTNGQTPTYSTVRYFVTETSAKTKFDGVDTSFFKIKFNNTGKNPVLKTMPYGSQSIKAYEIEYEVAGQTYLEALNVTNGDDLKIFAAVIKTDYNGNPVDTDGRIETDPEFSGIYELIQVSNTLSITINYYLESLNIYSIDDSADPVYTLRNVQATGSSSQDTIQLLADQEYVLKASPYYLNDSGAIDLTNPAYTDTANIDYTTNLKLATLNAYNKGEIKFKENLYNNVNTIISFDQETVMFDIELNVGVDETASYGHTTDAFDFNAYGIDSIEKSFDKTRSTVNMQVNYASIADLSINTTSDVAKDKYVLSPQVIAMDGDSNQATISWVEENQDVDNMTPFSMNILYSLDIQNMEEQDDGSLKYNSKIDRSFGTDSYVENYIQMITNPLNTDAIKFEWSKRFVSGNNSQDVIDDYITIIEDVVEENGNYYSVTRVQLKKGTREGIEVQLTCTLSLYKTDTSYIDYRQASINLVLKQPEVTYKGYSLKTHNADSVLVVNGSDAQALEVQGGGNDGTVAEGYNLLINYGTTGLPVYKYDPGTGSVIPDANNPDVRANGLLEVSLGADGQLAMFCTYTIVSDGNNVSPIYFKDSSGNRVYTATPTNGKLYFYVDYLSEDKNVTIRVTSPFNDGTSYDYRITVKSSIILSRPAGNVETMTTAPNGGKIDLSSLFKATKDTTELDVSFEILDKDGGSNYATLASDGITLIPHEVLSVKTVFLQMTYEVDSADGSGTSSNSVTTINGSEIAVLIQPGYTIVPNQTMQAAESGWFTIFSGETFDFFDAEDSHYQWDIKSSFVTITNKYTNSVVDKDEDVDPLLEKLFILAYDEQRLAPADAAIFATLFENESTKNDIKYGKLKTRSISSNITVPIKLYFSDGASYDEDYPSVGQIRSDAICTFYCVVKASVEFDTPKKVASETNGYDETEGLIEFNYQPVEGAIFGQTFVNSNIDTDGDGDIEVGEYRITLFDVSSDSNVLSLHGVDGNELLHTVYNGYALYRLVEDQYEYVNGVDYNFEVIETFDQSTGYLSTLILNFKNSVNTTTHYKLCLTTDINKENETFDYYFTAINGYSLLSNYPLEDGKEKVRTGTKIDLTTAYINQKERIQISYWYDDASRIMDLANVDGTTYTLTSRERITEIDKQFTLATGQTPITYSIISGTAASILDGKILEFGQPNSTTETVVVRATLFNGSYVDYQFEVFTSALLKSEATVQTGIELYGDTEFNLLDYLSAPMDAQQDFKYVIKYNGPEVPTNADDRTNDTYINFKLFDENDEVISDKNKILPYSGAILKLKFSDIDLVNGLYVSFNVWTNYSIAPEECKTLIIKVKSNLQIVENTSVTELVANTENILMGDRDDAWLRLYNTDYENITITPVYVNKHSYDFTENKLGITITEKDLTDDYSDDDTRIYYTFTSFNIGEVREIIFHVSRETIINNNRVVYYRSYTIRLVPNINLNSIYSGTNTCNIDSATGAEGTRVIVLNNVEGGQLITPTDFAGNSLSAASSNGDKSSTSIASFTAVLCDADGNDYTATDLINKAVYGVEGISVNNVTTINLTVNAINSVSTIFVKITVTWPSENSVNKDESTEESYVQILNITLKPNIETSTETVNYATGSELTVFAGSRIDLTFTNGLTLSQTNTQTATIVANQRLQTGTSTNAAYILFNVKNEEDDPYYFGFDGTQAYIEFKGVPQETTVSIPYYYDLSGRNRELLYVDDNTTTVVNPLLNAFNDPARKIDFDDSTVVYRTNYVQKYLKIKIKPSMSKIEYTNTAVNSEGKLPNAENGEGAIDITQQLVNLYVKEMEPGSTDIVNNSFITVSPDSLDPAYIVDYNPNATEVHGYNLINLFNFTPVSGATFTASSTDVYVNKQLLYPAIQYTVEVRSGTKDKGWVDMAEKTDSASSYYYIDKVNGIIYFIPPAMGAEDTLRYCVTMQLPGYSGVAGTYEKIFFDFQYSGEVEYFENVTNKEIVGNGGDIVGNEMFTSQDPNYSPANDRPSEYGIDLNKVSGSFVETYNLDNLFDFGYVLRTSTTSLDINTENKNKYTAKNIRLVYGEDDQVSFVYLLNNVPIRYGYGNEDSRNYMTITGNTLKINPYFIEYIDNNPDSYSNIGESFIRKISISVTAGPIIETFDNIPVYPREITIGFNKVEETNRYVFVSNVSAPASGNGLGIETEDSITLDRAGFTDDEYEMFSEWLKIDPASGKYVFEPNKDKLTRTTTFKFKNALEVNSVGSTDIQVFNKELEITIEPNVGLDYYYVDGISPNLTGNGNIDLSVLTENIAIDRLFTSKIFTSDVSDTYGTISATLSEVGGIAGLDYSKYVTLKNVTTTTADGLNTYTLNDASIISILENQTIADIVLPYNITIKFGEQTLTKTFDLIIKTNAGVTGLGRTYTITRNNSWIGVITLDNVYLVGSGEIKYRVSENNFSISGSHNLDEDNLQSKFNFTTNKGSAVDGKASVVSINVDYSLLMDQSESVAISALRAFDLEIYYSLDRVDTLIKTITIIISNP